MKCMRRLFVVVGLLCAGLAWAGVAEAGKRTVLVIPKDMTDVFWQGMDIGAKKAGEERNVRIIYRGGHTQSDREAQLGIIEFGISNRVDAIVIAPVHKTDAVELLEQAARQGIKVVIVDSDCQFEERVSYVASDNYQAGRTAAEFLFSHLKSGDKVLFLEHLRGSVSTLMREQGFKDIVRETDRSIQVVSTGYVGGSKGDAYRAVKAAFHEHPDINAVFTSLERISLATFRALKELGRLGSVDVVGFDYAASIHDALEQGYMLGTMVQTPEQMGYLGVMAACDALDGKDVEPRIVTPTTLVTSENNDPQSPLLRVYFPKQ